MIAEDRSGLSGARIVRLPATRSDATPPLLAVEAVSHAYGATRVLSGVGIDVRQGEFLTLLGPSGCGKTTLLRLIAGFEPLAEGRITMDGRDLAALPPERRPINTVFQNYALFPHLSVAQNVGFGLRMLGRGRAETAARVAEMLALVRLTDLADRRVTRLSGGQQQRVALARALAPAPRLLLLDEPLGALDQKLRQEMQVELRRIQQSLGMTFVFVTHDQEEALSMSDRVAIMRGGRLVQCDTPLAVYRDPVDAFVASFLGDANFLAGRLRVVEHGHARVQIGPDLVRVPAVRPVAASGEVRLMVRPEDVLIGAHDGLRLTARIERQAFLGSDHCLHLRLPGGEAIRVRARGDDVAGPLPVGEPLTLTVPHRHLRLVGDA